MKKKHYYIIIILLIIGILVIAGLFAKELIKDSHKDNVVEIVEEPQHVEIEEKENKIPIIDNYVEEVINANFDQDVLNEKFGNVFEIEKIEKSEDQHWYVAPNTIVGSGYSLGADGQYHYTVTVIDSKDDINDYFVVGRHIHVDKKIEGISSRYGVIKEIEDEYLVIEFEDGSVINLDKVYFQDGTINIYDE